jgi:hypothetical protein
LKLNDKLAITKQERVNLYADTLQEMFRLPQTADENSEFCNAIEDAVGNFVNHHKMGRLIGHYKYCKAAGKNSKQHIVLQRLPTPALTFIATFHNPCITNNDFPTQCKVSRIIIYHNRLTISPSHQTVG